MTQHRPERVADLIRQILARVMREELRDPRIGFLTLTDVHVSPDLRHARVFVSTMDQEPQAVLRALRRAAPFLRRSLARSAQLRYVPELRFSIDESTSTGFQVDRILHDLGLDREDTEDETP